MQKCKTLQAAVFIVITGLLLCSTELCSGKTLKLSTSGKWQDVNTSSSGIETELLKIKEFINNKKPAKILSAAEFIKKQYPQAVDKAFNLLIEADRVFAEGKYLKAVRKYNNLIKEYPQSSYRDAALDRLYNLAVMLLNGQKVSRLKVLKLKGYEEAEKIMENIADIAGDSPLAKRALITLAESQEKRGDFSKAYKSWASIYSKWSVGKTGREALLAMARSLHSAYKGYKFDSKSLESAKSYYYDFKNRYPKDAKEIDLQVQLGLIQEQLAFKEYNVGKYYRKADQKQAAILYFQSVISQWPKSSAAQLAKDQLREIQKEKIKKEGFDPIYWWFNPEKK